MIEIYFRKHYATCIILLFLTICSFTGAHGQINLQNGLLACYSFTGNADDGTGHGNNGTINGASLTSDRFGNANSAYTFDGIDDYISIQPNPFLNENYTYSLWVSANSIPSAGIAYRLISIGGPAGDQNVDLSNNYFGTTGWDGGGYDINSPASITAVSTGSLPNKDVWFHILVTRDVANVKLYINGQIFGTSSTGGRLPYYGNRTKIGATIGGRSVVNQFAHAKLDDIRIYDRALSTDEVTELYTNPPICEPAHDLQLGLLACYSFSGNANDGSGNGKNGTVNGATLTVDRFGNANSAYSFDGNNDHISIPPNNLQNNNYTYSLWANVSAFPSDGETFRMLSIGGPGGDQDVSLSNSYVNTSKGWDGAGYNIGGSVTNYSVGSLPTLNTWNYITVTRDNSSIKLYINGQLAGSASTNGLNPYYGNGLVQAIIGSRSTLVQPFNGAIDDIRIYNRALSATEVTELYTHPSTCEPAPDLQQGLLACYPFTGNANDLSGTGNNGTVKGATLTTDRFGNLNSAYSFDGIDDQINISPNNLLNNNYTYSVWGKASSIPAAQSAGVLFSVGQSGGDQGVSLNNVYLGANTSVGWVGGGINQNSQYTAAVAGSLPNVNTWYHITVTRTNFSASLFVNGQLVSTALSNSSLPRYTINGAQGRIGTRSNEIQFFNGAIDDIRIYNRALSTAEVTLLYNAPNIGNISIQASNLTPCAKEEVTFTVSPSIGGDAQYQWKVDGVNQGSLSASTTFTYTFPNNSPVYTATVGVDVSSEANCISASTQTMVTVTPSLVPSVVLSADKANPCAEEEVTFTAMPTNGGLLPLYQWKIDGVNQGAASTDATFSHTFANAAQAYTKAVSVELTSNLACVSPTQGSGQMSIPVKPLLVSALSVTPSNLSPCGGKEVSFTASPTIGGDAQYQWKVDGVNTGGLSSSPVFLYTFANTSQAYTATVSVEASSNTRCGLPTGQSTLAVTPSPVPSVTVIADNYKPCQGAVVLFTATPTNGGSSPLYQWQMDGVNQGTESGNATFSHIFTTTAQAYTSIVSVVMTSNAVCASPTQGSAQASVAIDPTAIPSVIVMAANAKPCADESIQFTATPTNGGVAPLYQWSVDGVNRGSASSESTLLIAFPNAAQSYAATVSVEMITACASASHGFGQSAITVQPLVTPSISISANEPISCTNTATSFTATPSIGGAMYQWKINDVNQGVPTTLSSFLYPFPGAPAEYTIGVEVSFPASCLLPASAKKMIIVAHPSVMQVAVSVNDQEICAGQTSNFWVYPPMAGATYQWKINGVDQGTLTQEPTFSTIFSEKTQSYNAIVSVDVFPNQRCIAIASEEIQVTINPNPIITCFFPETAENGNLTKYAVHTTGGRAPYQYRWTFGNDTIQANGKDSISYAFPESGLLAIEVQVTDSKGCEARCQSSIRSLFFPNIFTPNGDGQNDTFTIRYEKTDFEMQVFNRWGTLVCKTQDGIYGWDGEGYPEGMYFYQIKIADKEYKGWLVLLR